MKPKSSISNRSAMADPAIIKEICHSLKQMRLSKNMTQAELAEMSGLNRVTISKMETGRTATLLTVVQVLRALDKLDILDIFREELRISPLQLLKLQEKRRQRASPTRKKTIDDREEKSEW
jgi:transcriptional regulator with XRE-family HTH domain